MDCTARISVVVPCFNHGEFLGEAVGSATGLGRPDIEVIVVDDGSTDERTRKELERLQKSGISVIQQENCGLAAARNAGVLASRGEYVFPLDADDRMRGGWVDRATEMLECDPKAGVVYGDAQCFGAKSFRWRTGRFDAQRLLTWNFIHASALYRRQIWDENRGYDGTMPVQGYEDWDFWISAAERGWKFVYVPEVFFEYRQKQDSMLRQAEAFMPQTGEFIVRKHARFCREAWLATMDLHESLRWSARHLCRVGKARLRRRFGHDQRGKRQG